MRIAIIGTRGIPNRYGGFEQLAECLSVGLFKNGHHVTVYSSHKHPNQEDKFNGVDIIHCFDPEYKLGTAGQFIYDLNCVRDARKRDFDVLLFLGYTSSSVWGKLYPKKTLIISNMDGLEWKRSKYSKPVQQFLLYAESLAVKYSDFLIADSIAIQKYLLSKFAVNSCFIPYGAEISNQQDESILSQFGIEKQNYFMLMARMEPENNIEMILDGIHSSSTVKKFIVVGDTGNRFGKYIVKKFANDKRIFFVGAIYDRSITNNLKFFCTIYFHGHSVGGTNPSLLEAMASRAMLAVHDNEFNKTVVGDDAYYFSSAAEVKSLIETNTVEEIKNKMTENNLFKIKEHFNWPMIVKQYDNFITECYLKCTK